MRSLTSVGALSGLDIGPPERATGNFLETATVHLNHVWFTNALMAGNSDVPSSLGSVSLFSGLNQKQLKMVVESGKELSYKSGDLIVKEGTLGVGFYLVLDGKVEVRKGSKVLASLSKGQFFGEMSMIDEQPRSADVIAVRPTKCFTLSTWVFSALLRQHPELTMPMLKEITKRLRSAQSSPTS